MSDKKEPVTNDIRIGFAQRLEELKGSRSERAFAKEIGISPTALHQYLKGQSEAGMTNLLRIANACNVSVSWLMTGEPKTSLAENDDYVAVPVLPEAVSAGFGSTQDENDNGAEDHFLLGKGYLRALHIKPQNAAILPVRGDSMEPTLFSGDLIIADTNDTDLSSAGVFVIANNGGAMVKRIMRRGDGSIMVISDNQALYPPEVITAANADGFRVIGRVRWHARTLR